MFIQLTKRFSNWKKRLRRSFGDNISTPEKRRIAILHYYLWDLACLRTVWTNFDQVAPGVYRSNHPTHKRLTKMREMGIRSVLNLRGVDRFAHYLLEKESCEALGLNLMDIKLYARKPAVRERILEVLDAFKTIERPFVMHCKSGADRAGFASALYLLAHEGATVEKARKQLSVRYLHLKWSQTGVLDHIIDRYAERCAKSPIGIEDWIRNEYDPDDLTKSFDHSRGRI